MGAPFRYRAFGLSIASEIPLEPFGIADVTSDAPIDLEVREGVPIDDGSALTWDGVCRIAGLGGKELWLQAIGSASPRDLALAVSGAGLALALHQRGIFVIHGSCVALNGSAVCFAGPSGVGKSTLASAFHLAGFRLVSDGMTAIQLSEHQAVALPGWPNVKLLPDAAESVGLHEMAAPRVHPTSEKSVYSCLGPDGQGPSGPVPLRWVFALEPGAEVEAMPLAPSAAVFELLRNSYLVDELRVEDQRAVLPLAAALADRVSVSRLRRGAAFSELPAVLDAVRALLHGD